MIEILKSVLNDVVKPTPEKTVRSHAMSNTNALVDCNDIGSSVHLKENRPSRGHCTSSLWVERLLQKLKMQSINALEARISTKDVG